MNKNFIAVGYLNGLVNIYDKKTGGKFAIFKNRNFMKIDKIKFINKEYYKSNIGDQVDHDEIFYSFFVISDDGTADIVSFENKISSHDNNSIQVLKSNMKFVTDTFSMNSESKMTDIN